MKEYKIIITAFILAVFMTAGILYFKGSQFGSGEGYVASACSVSTVTAAVVGDDVSSTLLSAHSRRAWATIELVFDDAGVATNTVSVSFDEGADAVLNNGVDLATNTPQRKFGLNTEFPYTGAVTGITNTGSTSVLVTECRY